MSSAQKSERLTSAYAFLGDNPVVDRELYPHGLGVLTSDPLMHPVNMENWPVRIDSSHQLFLDDYLIARRNGVGRTFHQPRKHPDNPILRPVEPWENKSIIPFCVLHEEGLFRLWYGSHKSNVLYAESDDGTTWRRPRLGIAGHAGLQDTNIVIDGGFAAGIMRGGQSADDTRPYQAIIWQGPPQMPTAAFYLHDSADGIHWSLRDGQPAMRCDGNPELFGTMGVGDTSHVSWDPVLRRYICDAKVNVHLPRPAMEGLGFVIEANENRIRTRALMESPDLRHWSRPRMTFFPDDRDERDAQMYGHIGSPYESMWVGMLRVLHVERTGWKQTEIEVTYSRDGLHWSRPSDRRQFIPLGPDDGWEPDYSMPVSSAPLLIDDELWFYYGGSRSAPRDRKDYWASCIGLAKLRRDGYASLDAGEEPGTVVTRPLSFEGRSLFVNADTAAGGSIAAEVLHADHERVNGFSAAECNCVVTDGVRSRITWAARSELPEAIEVPLRIRFTLQRASLYAFWIE